MPQKRKFAPDTLTVTGDARDSGRHHAGIDLTLCGQRSRTLSLAEYRMMTEPLPIEYIHHVSRVTRDLDRSIRFYCDVLGFQPLDRPGFNFRGAWLFNYGLQIHLIESENQSPPNTEIQAQVDHIAFRVSDIDTVKRLLNEGGIEYASRHVPDTGVTQVFFLDPDGNHIECGMYPPTITE